MVQILNGQKGKLIRYETMKEIIGVPEGYILDEIETTRKFILVKFVKDVDISGLFDSAFKHYYKIMEIEELKDRLKKKGIDVGNELFLFSKFIGFKKEEVKTRGARITYSDEKVEYDEFFRIDLIWSPEPIVWLKRYPERIFFWLTTESEDNDLNAFPSMDSELV